MLNISKSFSKILIEIKQIIRTENEGEREGGIIGISFHGIKIESIRNYFILRNN
jgi:hypothetical protein